MRTWDQAYLLFCFITFVYTYTSVSVSAEYSLVPQRYHSITVTFFWLSCSVLCCSAVSCSVLQYLDRPQLAVRWPCSTSDSVDNTWLVVAFTARTKAIYTQNRDFCLPHLHSTPPLRGFPSKYQHPVWFGKMVWLPDGEKISTTCLFVLT